MPRKAKAKPLVLARLAPANQVLAIITRQARLEIDQRRYICVVWPRAQTGQTMWRRWMCRGNDFYPVWSRQFPFGGTATMALSQLVRWVQDKPVLPLATWSYWLGDRVALAGDRQAEVVDILQAADYPSEVPCVLCGTTLTGSLDWWRLDGVSGPCCGWTAGCRQQGKEARHGQ